MTIFTAGDRTYVRNKESKRKVIMLEKNIFLTRIMYGDRNYFVPYKERGTQSIQQIS